MPNIIIKIEKVTPYLTEQGEQHGMILARDGETNDRVKVTTRTLPKVAVGETYSFEGALGPLVQETQTKDGKEIAVTYQDGTPMKTRRILYQSTPLQKIGISQAESGW